MRRLIFLLDELRQGDLAVGDEIVGRHGRVVEHGEADLLRVSQQIRGERLVPRGLPRLVLGRGALDRDLQCVGVPFCITFGPVTL